MTSDSSDNEAPLGGHRIPARLAPISASRKGRGRGDRATSRSRSRSYDRRNRDSRSRSVSPMRNRRPKVKREASLAGDDSYLEEESDGESRASASPRSSRYAHSSSDESEKHSRAVREAEEDEAQYARARIHRKAMQRTNKIADVPRHDGNQVDVLRPSAKSFPVSTRRCRDWPILFLFMALVGGMGYLCWWAVSHGDTNRLIYGTDSFGAMCGQKTVVNGRTFDLTDRPNLFFFNETDSNALKLCVKDCPSSTGHVTLHQAQLGLLCAYGFNYSAYTEDVFSSVQSNLGPCPIYALKTKLAMHRCVPESKDDSAISAALAEMAAERPVAQAVLSDLYFSSYLILACIGVSLVTSLLFAILVRVRADLLIGVSATAVACYATFCAILFYLRYQGSSNAVATWAAGFMPIELDASFLLGSMIVLIVVTVVILGCAVFFNKRSTVANQLMRDASIAVQQMPSLSLHGLIHAIVFALVCWYAIYIGALLLSTAEMADAPSTASLTNPVGRSVHSSFRRGVGGSPVSVKIRTNTGSNLCLDSSDAESIAMKDCELSPMQNWFVTDPHGYIQRASDGLCLTMDGSTTMVNPGLKLSQCVGSVDQVFKLDGVTGTLTSRRAEITCAWFGSGSEIKFKSCDESIDTWPVDIFTAYSVPPVQVHTSTGYPGAMCLDGAEELVRIHDCDGSVFQDLDVLPSGQITRRYDDKCLELQSTTDADSSALVFRACADQDSSQLFTIIAGGDFTSDLHNRCVYIEADYYLQIKECANIASKSLWDASNQLLNVDQLLLAAGTGTLTVEVAEDFLYRGGHIDRSDGNSRTALMLAAEAGDTEAVTVLIANDAALDLKDSDGVTALMFGSANENGVNIVYALLQAGANPLSMNVNGDTAADYACLNDREDVVELLQFPGPRQIITNTGSNLCVDSMHGILYAKECSIGPFQNWEMTAQGLLRRPTDGLCVTAEYELDGSGAKVLGLKECEGLDSQRFEMTDLGQVKSLRDGFCFKTVDENKINLVKCIESSGTKVWTWNTLNPYRLRSDPNTDLCFDSLEDAGVMAAQCVPGEHQNWLVATEGYITRRYDDKCLTVEDPDSATDNYLSLSPCRVADTTQFFEINSDGQVINSYNGRCVFINSVDNTLKLQTCAASSTKWDLALATNEEFQSMQAVEFLFASKEGELDAEQLEQFREQGGDINVQGTCARTALNFAAQNGHTNAVELLMLAGADLEVKDRSGRTALYRAVVNENVDVIAALLGDGADIYAMDHDGNTAKEVALATGNPAVYALLRDAEFTLWAEGGTLTSDQIDQFVTDGGNVNMVDSDGVSMKDLAKNAGFTTVYELLRNRSFLERARAGSLSESDIKVYLEEDNGNLDFRLASSGETALIAAAANGRTNVVDVLLDAEADVDITNVDGKTAGELAKENGHLNAYALLRDVHFFNDIKGGLLSDDIIVAFVNQGGDLDMIGRKLTTPLTHTFNNMVQWQIYANVEILVAHGADLTKPDGSGNTVHDVGCREHNDDIVNNITSTSVFEHVSISTNTGSNDCWDVSNEKVQLDGISEPVYEIQAATCEDSPSQHYIFHNTTNGTITRRYDGLCVSAADKLPYPQLVLYPCDGGDWQRFELTSDGTIKSMKTGQCAVIEGAGKIQTQDCTSSSLPTLIWQLVMPSLDVHHIGAIRAGENSSTLCLDSSRGGLSAVPCIAWHRQDWSVTQSGLIVRRTDDKCVALLGAAHDRYSSVHYTECDSHDDNQGFIFDRDNGALRSRRDSMCLDVLQDGSVVTVDCFDQNYLWTEFSKSAEFVGALNGFLSDAEEMQLTASGVDLYMANSGDIRGKDTCGSTALAISARKGYLDAVKLLAELDENVIDDTDIFGNTPLMLAAEEGHMQIVEYLVTLGASVSDANANMDLAVDLADAAGQGDIARILRNQEFFEAAAQGTLTEKIVQDFLEKGGSIEAHDSAGRTALVHAAVGDHADSVQLLLDASSSIQAQDEGGMTALIAAAGNNNYDLSKQLLLLDANIIAATTDHVTAQDMACRVGNEELVTLLQVPDPPKRFASVTFPDLCLDSSNAEVRASLCEDSPFQKWAVSPQGEFRRRFDSMCLSVTNSGELWSTLELEPCMEEPEQRFAILASGEVQSQMSGLCFVVASENILKLYTCGVYLDRFEGSTASVAQRIQTLSGSGLCWDSSHEYVSVQNCLEPSEPQQEWVMLSSGVITRRFDDKCVSVDSPDSINNAWVSIGNCIADDETQTFELLNDGQIRSLYDGRCVIISPSRDLKLTDCSADFTKLWEVVVITEAALPSEKQELLSGSQSGYVADGVIAQLGVAGMLDTRGSCGRTGLMFAASGCFDELVRDMSSNGASLDTKDERLETALMKAVVSECPSTVALLSHLGADPFLTERNGLDVFAMAVAQGRSDILHLLDAEVFFRAVSANTLGQSDIDEYLQNENYSLDEVDLDGLTPLMRGARDGSIEVVRLLLANEAQISENEKAKQLAHENGHDEIFELLRNTAFLQHAQKGSLTQTMLDEYFKDGGFPNVTDAAGQTLLIIAARGGHVAVADLVLTLPETNIEGVDLHNCTALMKAAEYGHIGMVERLLQAGAIVDATRGGEEDGETAADLAKENGHDDVFTRLRDVIFMTGIERGSSEESDILEFKQNGGDIDVVGPTGLTPLMIAGKYGHVNLMRYLVLAGADISLRNGEGMTSKQIACEKPYVDTAQELVLNAPPRHIRINTGSNLCLDSTEDTVSALTCATSPFQHWVFTSEGYIQRRTDGKCMTAEWDDGKQVYAMKIDGCREDDSNQVFELTTQDELINTAKDLCAIISHNSMIALHECDGPFTQLWQSVHDAPAIQMRANTTNSEDVCLDAQDGVVVARHCDSNMLQDWSLTKEGMLTHFYSDLCVTPAGDIGDAGKKLELTPCDSAKLSQTFELLENGRLRSLRDGLCVSVSLSSDVETHGSDYGISGYAVMLDCYSDSATSMTWQTTSSNDGDECMSEFLEAVRTGKITNVTHVTEYTGKDGCALDAADVCGQTALHVAADYGMNDAISALISAGANVNAINSNGWTPAIFAARAGRDSILWELFTAGTHLDWETYSGSTAYDVAMTNDEVPVAEFVQVLVFLRRASIENDLSQDVIDEFLQQGGNIDVRMPLTGETALVMASISGASNNIRTLAQAGASTDIRDQLSLSPLMHAAEVGCIDCIEILLSEAAADVSLTDADERTALFKAAAAEQNDAITFLVQKGANINKQDVANKTVLHHAAEAGNLDTVSVLLDLGVNHQLLDESGHYAEDTARISNWIEVFELIRDYSFLYMSIHGELSSTRLEYFIDVGDLDIDQRDSWGVLMDSDKTDGADEWTALMKAANNGHANTVSLLISEGADRDLTDSKGNTARSLAKNMGHSRVVQLFDDAEFHDHADSGTLTDQVLSLFMASGGDIDVLDAKGRTAFMIAVRDNHFEAASLLAEAGAHVNVKDYKDETALMMAAEAGYLNMIELLLKHYADPTLEDPNGSTALKYASWKGHDDIVDVLAQHLPPYSVSLEVGINDALCMTASGDESLTFQSCHPSSSQNFDMIASTGQLKRRNDGACLTAVASSKEGIYDVKMLPCGGEGEANQTWYLATQPEYNGGNDADATWSLSDLSDKGHIMSALNRTHTCLYAVNITGDTRDLQVGICDSNTVGDTWKGMAGYNQIIRSTRGDNLCLDSAMEYVRAYPCVGSTSYQRWEFSLDGQLTRQMDGRCFEVVDKTLRIAPSCNESLSQRFVMTEDGQMQSNATGQCVVSSYMQSGEVTLIDCSDVERSNAWRLVSAPEATADMLEETELGQLSIDKLQEYISVGGDVNDPDTFGTTLLMVAAKMGLNEDVAMLLSLGARTDAQDIDGMTPLMFAASNNATGIVQLLIGAGADLFLRNGDGVSARDMVIRQQLTELFFEMRDAQFFYEASGGICTDHTIRSYLSDGGMIDARSMHYDNQTALMVAAEGGHRACTSALLVMGATVTLINEDGKTAKDLANEGLHLDVYVMLKNREELSSDELAAIVNADAVALEDDDSYAGQTALILAARENHVDLAVILLNLNADPDIQNSDGWTALIMAAANNHYEIAKLLLDNNARTDIETNAGKTAEDLASFYNHDSIVTLLLASGFFQAVEQGTLDKSYLELYLWKGGDIEQKDGDFTAIYVATKANQTSVVTVLIDAGAMANVIDPSNGRTPLHYAAANGLEDVVTALLGSDISVEQVDSNGDSAKDLAIAGNHTEVVNILRDLTFRQLLLDNAITSAEFDTFLQEGGDIDIRDGHGRTALLIAAAEEDLQLVDWLLGAGADATLVDNDGWSAAMETAKNNNSTILNMLIVSGIDIEQTNNDGDRAKEIAHAYNSDEVFSILRDLEFLEKAGNGVVTESELLAYLEEGGDIEAVTTGGKTLLMISAESGFSDQVKLMTDNGAEIDARDSSGNSAVMLAAASGHDDIVWHLMDLDAAVTFENDDGKTAKDLAAEGGHQAIFIKLRDQQFLDDAMSGNLSAPQIETYIFEGGDINLKDGTLMTLLQTMTNSPSPVVSTNILKVVSMAKQVLANEGVPSQPSFDALLEDLLFVAAVDGNIVRVQDLILAGANVDALNVEGKTAAELATESGNTDVALLLLKESAMAAAHSGTLGADKISALVEAGGSVDVRDIDMGNMTLLMVVAAKSEISNIGLLLSSGADIDAVDSAGWSPIFHAARAGSVEVVTLLLGAGANVNVFSRDGESPATVAYAYHHVAVGDILVALMDTPPSFEEEENEHSEASVSTSAPAPATESTAAPQVHQAAPTPSPALNPGAQEEETSVPTMESRATTQLQQAAFPTNSPAPAMASAVPTEVPEANEEEISAPAPAPSASQVADAGAAATGSAADKSAQPTAQVMPTSPASSLAPGAARPSPSAAVLLPVPETEEDLSEPEIDGESSADVIDVSSSSGVDAREVMKTLGLLINVEEDGEASNLAKPHYVFSSTQVALFSVHVLGIAWILLILQGAADTITAGVVGVWYWTHPRCRPPPQPLKTAIKRTIPYHIGTLVLGGLVNPAMKVLYFITKLGSTSTYVVVALQGKAWLSAAWKAAAMVRRNPLMRSSQGRLAVPFGIFLAKVSVTLFCALVAAAYISYSTLANRVAFSLTPLVAVVLMSWGMASVVLGLIGTAVETIRISFCRDIARNRGTSDKPYHASDGLMLLLEDHGNGSTDGHIGVRRTRR